MAGSMILADADVPFPFERHHTRPAERSVAPPALLPQTFFSLHPPDTNFVFKTQHGSDQPLPDPSDLCINFLTASLINANGNSTNIQLAISKSGINHNHFLYSQLDA
jgi:hypothetical protein